MKTTKESIPLIASNLIFIIQVFVDNLALSFYSDDAVATFGYAISYIAIPSSFLVVAGTPVMKHAARKNNFNLKSYLLAGGGAGVVISLLSFCAYCLASHWLPNREILIYLLISSLFLFTVPIQNILNSYLIAKGKSKQMMKFSVITVLTNTFLNIILIFGVPSFIPSLGVLGAAYASIFSEILGVIITLYYLSKYILPNKIIKKRRFYLSYFLKFIYLGGQSTTAWVRPAILMTYSGSIGTNATLITHFTMTTANLLRYIFSPITITGVTMMNQSRLTYRELIKESWLLGPPLCLLAIVILSIFIFITNPTLLSFGLISAALIVVSTALLNEHFESITTINGSSKKLFYHGVTSAVISLVILFILSVEFKSYYIVLFSMVVHNLVYTFLLKNRS